MKQLIATVPEIEHPSSVLCDDEGNLFLAEDPMDMRGPSTEPGDRILLMHWDAKTGKPHKTVFCQNLSATFGMVWDHGTLYVMHAPFYSKFQDTNGDGVADVRKDLVHGFGHAPGEFGLNNHIPSGIELGLDGFVYVSVGDKGIPKAVGADGSTITLEGGGVVRMRLDGTQLEIVSRGIRNHLEVALDSFDNLFAYDNDDDFGWSTRLIHHVPTGYYGYPFDYRTHPERALPPVSEQGAGVPCGGTFYREANWPGKFREAAFFCEWGEGKIECFRLKKKGASFTAQVDDFMVDDGSGTFRPMDLCFSPDGKHMYVADWNFAGGKKPDQVGRLFRVTYIGGDSSGEKTPRATDRDPIAQQLRSLDHPSYHERVRAQHRLVRIGKPAVASVADVLHSNAPVRARIHALWTQNGLIDQVAGYAPAVQWIELLSDPNAELRAQVARALGERRISAAAQALASRLEDSDAAVRMWAAIGLGRIGQADSAYALFDALSEKDIFARFCMIQALRAINNWEPALTHLKASGLTVHETNAIPAGSRGQAHFSATTSSTKGENARRKMSQTPACERLPGGTAVRAAVLLALTSVYDTAAVNVLSQWSQQAADPDERIVALEALADVHRKVEPYTGGWWGGKAAGHGPPRPKNVEWAGTATVLAALENGLHQANSSVRITSVKVFREIPSKELLPQLRELARQDPSLVVRSEAIATLAAQQDQNSVPTLLQIAGDDAADNTVRRHAIQALLSLDAKTVAEPLTRIVLDQEASASLVVEALAALGQLKPDHVETAIATRLHDKDVKTRATAIRAYAQVADRDAVDRVIPALQDSNIAVRRATLLALGDWKAKRAVPALIAAAADATVRAEAIRALGAVPDRRALTLYLEALTYRDVAVRAAAQRALRTLGTSIAEELSVRYQRHQLSTAVLRALHVVFLGNRTGFEFLYDKTWQRLEQTDYVQFATTHAGDPKRGRQLFAETADVGCIKCHSVAGVGATVGPDLAGVGAKYPRSELIRSVLQPSDRILTDYEIFIVLTTAGKVYQGTIKWHTDKFLDLVTPEGQTIRIPNSEVEIQKLSPLSPMPNGLSKTMTPEDFANLIAYLESLKEPQTTHGE